MDYNKLTAICKDNLLSSERALAYIQERGLSSSVIDTFDIGYCPISMRSLLSGTDESKLLSRLVFPIRDAYGTIIAFAGRSIDNRKPKYINTEYKKSSHFFNLDKAKCSILEYNYVVLVEGYMDAISLYSRGVTNVVALCGVAFKLYRLALLARYTNRALVLLDEDETGREASSKVIKLMSDYGFDTMTLPLYPYKDIDESLNKGSSENILYNIENIFTESEDIELDNIKNSLNYIK